MMPLPNMDKCEVEMLPPHLNDWLAQLEYERDALYQRVHAIERVLVRYERLRPERALPRRGR